MTNFDTLAARFWAARYYKDLGAARAVLVAYQAGLDQLHAELLTQRAEYRPSIVRRDLSATPFGPWEWSAQ